jgi:alkylmercury lyase-like protein
MMYQVDVDSVRVEIYRSFVESGRAPMPAELATTLGHSVGEIESALTRLHDDDVIVLLPGTSHVWLAHPFSAAGAPFQVNAEDRRWDAICIWDALGILALVGSDGTVETRCPDCGDPLSLEIHDGQPIQTDHVVHFGVPAARWYEDIGYT